jgi:iron complex transport system permease protein
MGVVAGGSAPDGLLDESRVLSEYTRFTARKTAFIVALAVAIVLLGSFAITIGPLEISIAEVYSTILHRFLPAGFSAPSELAENIMWYVRLPRLLMGLAAGFSLAVAGAVMQPVLRNPLASPFTLGISAGAGFGAAVAIILGKSFGGGSYFVVVNAFVFSLLTTFVIIGLSRFKGATPETMILAGIAISYLFGAATTLIEYFAEAQAVREIVFWLVGSLARATWSSLRIMFPVILCCITLLIVKSWDLNVMSVGDEAAKSLGVNVERTRILLMVVASLLTATTVCFTGTIGFIGLVAPHITRMIIGGDNRFVVPASGFVGALLLVGADIVAVNIIAPIVLPIGIMTSFMGVPLFIYLIMKKRKEYWI